MMPSDCHTGEDLRGHIRSNDASHVEPVKDCTARSHVTSTGAGAPVHLTEKQSVQQRGCECRTTEYPGESLPASTQCSGLTGRMSAQLSVSGQGSQNSPRADLHNTESCTDHFVQSCSKVGAPSVNKGKHISGTTNSDNDSLSSTTKALRNCSPTPRLVAGDIAEGSVIDASDSAGHSLSSTDTLCGQGAGMAHQLPHSSHSAVSFCTDENQNIAPENLTKENASAKGNTKCRSLASEKNAPVTALSPEGDSSRLLPQAGGDAGELGQPGISAEPGDVLSLGDPAKLPTSLQEDLDVSQLTGHASSAGHMIGLSQSCCFSQPASDSAVESLPFELIQSDIVLKPQPIGCFDSLRLTASTSMSEGGLGVSSATITSELYGQAESCRSLDVGQGSLRDIDSLPASEINLAQLGNGTGEVRLYGPAKLNQNSREVHRAESGNSGVGSESRSNENAVCGLSQHQQEPSSSEIGCDTRDGASPSSSVCVEDIPEELLLKIFSFFTPAQLCRHVTGVCRQWHCLAYDSSLWHSVDLSKRRVTGAQLRHIINHVPGAVRNLDISGLENLSVDDVGDLAACCPELTHLDAGFVNDLTGPMLQLVLMFCPKLCFLNLEGCKGANNEMMWVLAQNAGRLLKQLNFSHCFMTDDGLTMLTKLLTGLTHINIDGISWISDGVVRSLAITYMDSLECLELDGNYLTDKTLTSISMCHRLHTLSISFCEDLTDQSARCLLRLKNLEKLVLKKGPGLSSGLLVDLFSSPVFQNLKHLDLAECQQLTDEGVQTIARTCGLSLRMLNLSWCWNVTDIGMEAVAQRCRNLVQLYLIGIHRLEGSWLLTAVETMKGLTFINCEQCNEVNDNLIEEAVKMKPDLVIFNYYGEVFMHKRLQ